MLFYIMRVTRDEYGNKFNERVSFRNYKSLDKAKRVADSIKSAYVCPLGRINPVYVGAYQ